MILLCVSSFEVAIMSTLSIFNGIVNNGQSGFYCTLTREAILRVVHSQQFCDQSIDCIDFYL